MAIISQILRVLNFFISISAVGTLIYFHGFKYAPEHFEMHLIYLHFCFGFYLLQFIVKGFIAPNFRRYLKNNLIEYLILGALVVSMIVNAIFDFSLAKWLLSASGITELDHIYILFLHVWLLIIVGIELGKVATKSTIWKLPPPLLFILSFTVLIVIGSTLLMLPEMTSNSQGMSFIDAMFTSTSANCVTGLTIVDISTYFSVKGQLIILILIQIGGLNVIFFATFFISRFQFNRSQNKYGKTIKEFLHVDTLDGTYTKKMLRKILYTTLIIEFLGSAIIFNQLEPGSFSSNSDRAFSSVFHAVSSFNNAGFSIFSGGLTNETVSGLMNFHISVAVLIIIGGIGYTTIWELIRIKGFLTKKWSGSSILYGARISIISAILLTFGGMMLIYFFDSGSVTLDPLGSDSSWHHSFFQSVTSRTAGFNTVDIGNLSVGTFITVIILMFIGTSSGSTGGGIKTSTLYVLFLNFKDFFIQRKYKEPFGVNSLRLFSKARMILIYSLLIIFFGSLMLYVSEVLILDSDYTYLDTLFEETSAFATVGLSTGLTNELSGFGKIVIMTTMFIGRIGPLALAYTLVNSTSIEAECAPSEMMIG